MQAALPDALARARQVRLMIFDVDGVLTDGRLHYGPNGEEMKVFHSHDGHGMKMLARSGVVTALLSGRSSRAVELRAAELAVAHVLQGIDDKGAAFAALLARLGLQADAAGFMGDELVDLPVLRRCGFACAPREAPELVRRNAHYEAKAPAGAGAVREVCELVMQAQGSFDAALAPLLA